MDNHDDDDAQQAQKLAALGRFAGGIAHDFNNILSIIEGYAGIAEKQIRDGTVSPEALKKIRAATQRGAGLTRQLLAFASQKVAVEEPVDLCAELREMQVLLKPLFGETVALDLHLPETPCWVMASQDCIMQIVMNLALNARDAMPQGGRVTISCDDARLTVSDTGHGIPADVQARMFEPFYTTKDIGRGTGLGLSVVHGIVSQLGATISVQSQSGQGTRFDITFRPAAAPQRLRQPARASLKDRTILVTEDETDLRDVLGVVFENMEMKVLKASNGNEALTLQQGFSGDIDFLLTDIVMPGMDGVELGARFNAERPQSNVVYMSGYPNMRLPAGCDFIVKPLQTDIVRAVLERALARRDARLQQDGSDEEEV